jgi:hypothetical protein
MDLSALSRFIDPTGRSSDPRMINAVAAFCGATLASNDEIADARALAAARISDGVVTTEMFRAVQDITGSSVFVARENGKVTGMTAFFLLRPAGMQAFEEGRFDTINVNLDYICRPREEPAGGYAWGFVGITDKAAGRVVKASLAVREALLWNLAGYTRAATDDGARLVFGMLGFNPVPGDATLARYEARSRPFEGFMIPQQQQAA